MKANPMIKEGYSVIEIHKKWGDYNWAKVREGRPITLSDILIAISKNHKWENWRICGGFTDDGKTCVGILSLWNLKNNNLDNQSDKTKQFLADLLVVK